jgi:hypothetical protein
LSSSFPSPKELKAWQKNEADRSGPGILISWQEKYGGKAKIDDLGSAVL